MNEAEKAVYRKVLREGKRKEAEEFKKWCEERHRKEREHENDK